MSFFDSLAESIDEKDSVLCVGIDPDPDRIPDGMDILEFNRRIIESVNEHAAAFKPNSAYFEALNKWDVMLETIDYASRYAPVILDAKRGDVGFSSERYADLLDITDAITVNPYMGHDSVEPFIEKQDKGVFILTRTSNQGGSDFQELVIDDDPLYQWVAKKAASWDKYGNIGLVMGATNPGELRKTRNLVSELPFLVPGVGTQGGDIETAVNCGLNKDGVGVINSTRSIIYAGSEETVAGSEEAARELKEKLNRYRD